LRFVSSAFPEILGGSEKCHFLYFFERPLQQFGTADRADCDQTECV